MQAYRRIQLIDERRQALESVAGALEQEGRAFHVLGTPVVGLAENLLGAYYGDAAAGTLPPPVQHWAEQEQAMFQSGGPHRIRQPLVANRDGRRLTIRYVPGGRGPDLLWLDERVAEPDARPLERLGLTSRQADVLWLLTKGLPTKAVAHQLDLSVGTVKKHLEHVYRRLGVSTRTAAVAQAFDALSSEASEWT